MTDQGAARRGPAPADAAPPGGDHPRLRPPGPPPGSGAPRWLARLVRRFGGVRPTVRGAGVVIVVLGLLIGVAALTVGGDATGPGGVREPERASPIPQIDPDPPEPARTEPGGRDQLLLLAALVTGAGVLVVGAATSARRARPGPDGPARQGRDDTARRPK